MMKVKNLTFANNHFLGILDVLILSWGNLNFHELYYFEVIIRLSFHERN